MAPVLESWMSRPGRCSIIKAMTAERETEAKEEDEAGAEDESKEHGNEKGEEKCKEESKPEIQSRAPEQKAKIAQLEEITNASMATWQEKLVPQGTKCLYIIAVTVHPSHQGWASDPHEMGNENRG